MQRSRSSESPPCGARVESVRLRLTLPPTPLAPARLATRARARRMRPGGTGGSVRTRLRGWCTMSAPHSRTREGRHAVSPTAGPEDTHTATSAREVDAELWALRRRWSETARRAASPTAPCRVRGTLSRRMTECGPQPCRRDVSCGLWAGGVESLPATASGAYADALPRNASKQPPASTHSTSASPCLWNASMGAWVVVCGRYPP